MRKTLMVVTAVRQLAQCGVGGDEEGFDPVTEDLQGPDSVLFLGIYGRVTPVRPALPGAAGVRYPSAQACSRSR